MSGFRDDGICAEYVVCVKCGYEELDLDAGYSDRRR